MFSESLNLGLPEYAVSRAILELHETQEFVSARDIAGLLNCSEKTVYRALERLRSANKVRRMEGSPTWRGYRYDVER